MRATKAALAGASFALRAFTCYHGLIFTQLMDRLNPGLNFEFEEPKNMTMKSTEAANEPNDEEADNR